jgi:DNA-binding transcriptional regulator/RsmH inhibitor MraZ
MKHILSLNGIAQAFRSHPMVAKKGRLTVPMKHRARTTTASARLVESIRAYGALWDDRSTTGNAFFEQLKTDLNDLLEKNMFEPVVGMKAIRMLPKKNQTGRVDSAIGIMLCHTLNTEVDEHQTKTTATYPGYFVVQVSSSSNEYKMFAVIFKEDETKTEVIPHETPSAHHME